MRILNFSFVAKLIITHKAIGRINIIGIAILLKPLNKKRAPSGALLRLFSITYRATFTARFSRITVTLI